MAVYTDDEIRNIGKITLKIAGDYLGISPNAVGLGMRNNLLPIGFAVKCEKEKVYGSDTWSYHIIPERLIAYNHGHITEVQIQNVEKNLETLIEKMQEIKNDLVFVLSENAKQKI